MSTTVADLPKDLLIAEGLKGELLKEHNLKPTEATEKNVLPSAEDVQQEKTHQNFLTGKLKRNLAKLPVKLSLWPIKITAWDYCGYKAVRPYLKCSCF